MSPRPRQRQRKRDRRSPWLGRSVLQSPPNAAVAVTRPPAPGEGHQQGTVVMQVHSDSGRPTPNRQPKRYSLNHTQD